MKRARFSEEQIIAVLNEAEGGAKVGELCRRHGISDATFYTWRASTAGWRSLRCGGCASSRTRIDDRRRPSWTRRWIFGR
jgi:putative transposase